MIVLSSDNYAADLINTYLVRLFNQILAIEEQSLTEPGLVDLSMTEVNTIEAIAMFEPCTMSKVAEFLGITLGTLTTSVNRLVKKGYVQRHRGYEDRRRVFVELSERGEVVNDVHAKFHKRMVSQMTDELRLQDNIVLINSLKQLKDFFDNEYSHVNEYKMAQEELFIEGEKND